MRIWKLGIQFSRCDSWCDSSTLVYQKERYIGSSQYCNITKTIGKYRNTVLKINDTPTLQLDPFVIGHAYLKLPPSCMLIYLKHVCIMSKTYRPLKLTYWPACRVLFCIACMRKENANECYRNITRGLLLPNTISQRMKNHIHVPPSTLKFQLLKCHMKKSSIPQYCEPECPLLWAACIQVHWKMAAYDLPVPTDCING